MQAFKRVGVSIALYALSLSLAWAAPGFTAKAKLDGFQVVPPVLTPKQTATLALKFRRQPPPTTAAAGEALAQIPPIAPTRNFLAASMGPSVIRLAQRPPRPPRPSVWGMSLTEVFEQVGPSVTNIRLYLGQPFANGQPIATLCDDDDRVTDRPSCEEKPSGDDQDVTMFDEEFELNDILFKGQQTTFFEDFDLTIAGVTLDDPLDIVFVPDGFRLRNTETALEVIKALIERGLIYAVVNSKFTAQVNKSGRIIGYMPRNRGINGDGEMRGTLCLAPKGSRCPRNE